MYNEEVLLSLLLTISSHVNFAEIFLTVWTQCQVKAGRPFFPPCFIPLSPRYVFIVSSHLHKHFCSTPVFAFLRQYLALISTRRPGKSKPTAACSNKFHLLPGILIRQGENEADFRVHCQISIFKTKTFKFRHFAGLSPNRKEGIIQMELAHPFSLIVDL